MFLYNFSYILLFNYIYIRFRVVLYNFSAAFCTWVGGLQDKVWISKRARLQFCLWSMVIASLVKPWEHRFRRSAIAERRWTAAGSIRPRRRPGWRSTGRCTSGPPGTRSPSPSATVPSTCLPSSAGWSVSVPLFPPTTDAVMFSSCNTFNCRKLKWLSFDLIISDSWFVGSGRRDLYINLNTTKKSWSCYQVNKK